MAAGVLKCARLVSKMLSLSQILILGTLCVGFGLANSEPRIVVERRFEYGGNTYEISANSLSWYDANYACKQSGMSLVSVETNEENDAILANINDFPDDSFWTSGTDVNDEGNFYWDSTGFPFEYTYWGPGEPNNVKDQDCVQYWAQEGQRWDDTGCGYAIRFVCEKPTEP